MRKKPTTQKEPIRIAATSDIHGFMDGLRDEVFAVKPNFLVIAGDINPCYLHIDSHQWFDKEFIPFVEECGEVLDTSVVLVPGNHDFVLLDLLSHNTNGWCPEFPANLHLLRDSQETIRGVTFYGSPWVPWINGRWCWEASDKTLEWAFSQIPTGVDVLVTHSPPFIRHQFLDISLARPEASWRHFGSDALTKAIERSKPKMVFCGHIHTGQHGGVNIVCEDGTKIPCYNVSRVDEGYQVAHEITIIDFNPGETPQC